MSEKRLCVVSGSFDPITNGHLSLIRKAARLFDNVRVVVCVNSAKGGLLPLEKRLLLIEDAVKDLPNVTADRSTGLFADYCHENGVAATVKGIRNAADLMYEMSLAKMNEAIALAKGHTFPETVYLSAEPKYEYCSSSFVREMLRYGEEVTPHVPNAALLQTFLEEEREKEKTEEKSKKL